MPRKSRTPVSTFASDSASAAPARDLDFAASEDAAALPNLTDPAFISSNNPFFNNTDELDISSVKPVENRFRLSYGKVKALSCTFGTAIGYGVGHLANSSALNAQLLASSIPAVFVGGLLTYFNDQESRSWASFGKNIGYSVASALCTDLLVDTTMTTATDAGLCYWLPPVVTAASVVLLTEVAPKVLQPKLNAMCCFFKPKQANATEIVDKPAIPNTQAYSQV